MLAATVYIARQAGGRGEERSQLEVGAVIRGKDALPIEAEVRNLSRTGCLCAMSAILEVGSVVTIGISGIGMIDAHVVRQTDDGYGCEFLKPIAHEMVDAAQDADTVVAFPDRSFIPLSEYESTMPDPDRWSRGARVGFLIATSMGFWITFFGILRFL